METRSLGGVLLAFAGLVLLIAGFRGTLGKVWADVTGIGGTAVKDTPPSLTAPPVHIDGGAVLFAVPTGYAGTGNVLPAGVPASSVTG